MMVLCVVVLPLFFFSSQLTDAKRIGSIDYGKFAARYVQAFDAQWIQGQINSDKVLSHTQEIQGLADLGNSFQVIDKMQFVPIKRNDLVMLVVITIAPMLPLVLTMMPLSEVIKMLSGILF
jgi:hypothetical protein